MSAARNAASLARLLADADAIVHRLLNSDDTFRTIADEYRTSVRSVRRVALATTTPAELDAARRRKLSAAIRRRGWRPPSPSTVPVGTVRVETRGRSEVRVIKVRNARGRTAWVLYAAHVWRQLHGPVPRGHVVAHANDQSLDDRPENLLLLTRAEVLHRRRQRRPDIEARRLAALSAASRGHRRNRGRRWVLECDACGETAPSGPRRKSACPKCGSPAARKTFRRWLGTRVVAVDSPSPVAARPTAAPDPRVAQHLPVARRVAARMHRRMPRHVQLCDVESAAVDGLYAACRTFDPAKGASFRTHAARRVRGAILDWQRAHGWASRGQRAAAGEAGERRIVAATDLAVAGDRGEVDPVSSAVASPGADDAQADELWRRLLRPLPRKLSQVLDLVYRQGLNQREAAERLGYSESRGSQLHAEAVGRLRRRWTEAELAEAMGLGEQRRVA